MKLSVKSKLGSLTSNDVAIFEFQSKCKLPEDYRAFLLSFNGGVPSPENFDMKGEGACSIHEFYGIDVAHSEKGLSGAIATFHGRIKKGFIPIAADPYGNQICICISGRNRGKVYFWDHEYEGRIFYFRQITLIADSFNKFINNIYEYESADESPITRIVRLGSVDDVVELLESGYQIESLDKYGRSILETCAIHARNDVIELLVQRGAELRSALMYARKNAEFFDEHRDTVKLIERLQSGAA